ncbi:MAG TPA: hypothetical protein VMJ73_14955, partial [Rhizomicrobium sp.]|nr:hypothetical protein [Rhizomicrobium sp.]
ALRADPGTFGLVAANGGFLSKYSVGVYSTTPSRWKGFDSHALQAEVDSWKAPTVETGKGDGIVETYTIDYSGTVPRGVVIGRSASNGARFVAMTDPQEQSIARAMMEADPIGAKVHVEPNAEGRSIVTRFVPA